MSDNCNTDTGFGRGFLVAVVIGLAFWGWKSCTSPEQKASATTQPKMAVASPIPVETIENACSRREADCVSAIADRVVYLYNDKFSGTGFILYSDEKTITVLTASHVVREGNDYQSQIIGGLTLYDMHSGQFISARSSCAFFQNAYADIALIRFPNYRNRIFYRPGVPDQMFPGQKLLLVDQREYNQQRWFNYIIYVFLNNINKLVLWGSSQPGMSGSPMFTSDGRLAGVLIESNDYYNASVATSRLYHTIQNDLNYLFSKESEFAPYVCRRF